MADEELKLHVKQTVAGVTLALSVSIDPEASEFAPGDEEGFSPLGRSPLESDHAILAELQREAVEILAQAAPRLHLRLADSVLKVMKESLD